MLSRGRRTAAARADHETGQPAERDDQLGAFGAARSKRSVAVSRFLSAKAGATASTAAAFAEAESSAFRPDQLAAERSALPDGVNARQRERYLSADEFERLFGMSASDFGALPRRQRMLLKAKVGLLDGAQSDREITDRIAQAKQQQSGWASPSTAHQSPVRASTAAETKPARAYSPSATQAARSPRGVPPPQLLLPSGWSCAVSRSTGKLFYFNRDTGERQWRVPRFDGGAGRAGASPPRAVAPGRGTLAQLGLRPRLSSATAGLPSPGQRGGAPARPVHQNANTSVDATRRRPSPLQERRSPEGTAAVDTRYSVDSAPRLPVGWRSAMSRTRGVPFFYNVQTGEKQWQPP